MASSETRRKLTGVGVFILPVLIVKGTGVLLSPADVLAQGGSQGTELGGAAGLGNTDHEWTKQQLAAARHVGVLAELPFGDNPLYYKPKLVTTVHDPQQVERQPNDPNFNVTAVMKAGRSTIALVNGDMHREGDNLEGDAWKIVAIDQERRAVTFMELASGRTLTRVVQLPE